MSEEAFHHAKEAIFDFAERLRKSNEFGFAQKQLIYQFMLDELTAKRQHYGVREHMTADDWDFSVSDTIPLETVFPEGSA